MSLSEITEILDKAEKDEEYRHLLFSDSSKASIGYDLTDSEKQFLTRIGKDSYVSTKSGLISTRKMFNDACDFLLKLTSVKKSE
jgi:hypothetical protein|tara:strand:+ start:612 stop:863 length:252 start_codon:yes stop_codon:yes gene_type:complete